MREVAAREAVKKMFQVRGTYERVAEWLMNVIDTISDDRFLLWANYLVKPPSGYVAEFVDNVVPVLQREG